MLLLPFRRVLLAMYPQFAGLDPLSDVVLKWYHVTVFAYARTTAITTFASFLPHRAPTRLMPSNINTTKALPTASSSTWALGAHLHERNLSLAVSWMYVFRLTTRHPFSF